MFTPDFFIDVFQNTKKTVFNQMIADKTLQKASTEYVDAQTQFAKMTVHNTISVVKYSLESISKYWFPKETEKAVAPYKIESPIEKTANTDTQGDSDVK